MKIKLLMYFLLCIPVFAQAKVVTFHFSDMAGPSKVSGDCGGFSVWLKLDLKTETFVGGEVNEYEGGCKPSPKKIVQINHNPKTGKLVFFANYFTPDTLLKFDGTYYFKGPAIKGEFYQVDKETKAQKYQRKERSLKLRK